MKKYVIAYYSYYYYKNNIEFIEAKDELDALSKLFFDDKFSEDITVSEFIDKYLADDLCINIKEIK